MKHLSCFPKKTMRWGMLFLSLVVFSACSTESKIGGVEQAVKNQKENDVLVANLAILSEQFNIACDTNYYYRQLQASLRHQYISQEACNNYILKVSRNPALAEAHRYAKSKGVIIFPSHHRTWSIGNNKISVFCEATDEEITAFLIGKPS